MEYWKKKRAQRVGEDVQKEEKRRKKDNFISLITALCLVDFAGSSAGIKRAGRLILGWG